MSEKKAPKQKQLDIAIDEQTADGVYSNLAIINHSASEFIVDFITVMPGAPKARVKSRVILTPEHAKRFKKLWQTTSNVSKTQMELLKLMSLRRFHSILDRPAKPNIKTLLLEGF